MQNAECRRRSTFDPASTPPDSVVKPGSAEVRQWIKGVGEMLPSTSSQPTRDGFRTGKSNFRFLELRLKGTNILMLD